MVRGWLWVIRKLAAGPVRHVPPDALSVAGVLTLAAACGVVAVATCHSFNPRAVFESIAEVPVDPSVAAELK